MSVATEIVLGVVILGLLIYRQLRSRPVNASGLRIVAILAVIGVIQAYQFLDKHHSGAVTYAALGGSLVLAAVFGALRAATVRVWLQGGQPWSKGNWLTAALWIVALAAHLGYDALVTPGRGSSGLGAATVGPVPGRQPGHPARRDAGAGEPPAARRAAAYSDYGQFS